MARAEQRQAERGSIVLSAAVDYLTITTRNTEQYEHVKAWINREAGTRIPKTARSFMFEIENVDFASYGEGMHENQPIYIININGADSDYCLDYLINGDFFLPDEWKCTRIDIQLTVPATRTRALIELAGMYKRRELGDFADPKATAKVRGWTSDDGDSLYVGAPTSMLQIRIYDKKIIIGEAEYIYERFEAQLREDYAQGMFTAICKNRMTYNRRVILSSIKYYHNRLPVLLQDNLSQAVHLESTLAVQAERVITDKQERAKIRWALRLKKSLLELAREDSEDGIRVRQMLLEILLDVATDGDYHQSHLWKLVSPGGEVFYPLTDE